MPFLFLIPVAFLLFASSGAPPAKAAEIDHAREYRSCMTQAKRDPGQAFESALAWRDMGGGDAANHCLAVALMGLKQYAEAAKRFEALAQNTRKEAPFKAKLLAQAAQALLMDGQTGRADAALTSALKLKPNDVDLLIDRGFVRASLRRYREAVADFDRAIALIPGRADAFVFRAGAYRYLGEPEKALADANQALVINPDHPDGLLERGIILRLKGDKAGARKDWLKVLSDYPGSAAARVAGANLEQMDVKEDSP